MAFPVNGILDDFNRANEGPPPSANWTNPDPTVFTGTAAVVGNICDGTGVWSYYWNPAQFGPNCEAYAVCVSSPQEANINARLKDVPGSGFDGYSVRWKATGGEFNLYRIDNGSYTLLATSTGHTQNPGNSFGIEIIGSTLTAYKNVGAGWVSVVSFVDATHPAAGYIAMQGGTNANFDDFGGGSLPSGNPPASFRLGRGSAW